jgi:hypothetical protein
MNVNSRLSALAQLAEQHEVDRRDQNTSGEDLAGYLDHPETIRRWVAVTRSPEAGIVYLQADFATSEEAKRYAEEHMEDGVYDEHPVEVVDLDSSTAIGCRLRGRGSRATRRPTGPRRRGRVPSLGSTPDLL